MRPSLRADPWGRYYSSDWIGNMLVNAISINCPEIILELGAGKGSLASAAANKWQNSQIITVDLDTSIKTRIEVSKQHPLIHTHHIHDALDHTLSDHIGIQLSTVDVGVCNPPYIRPRWRSSFSKILRESGFSSALNSLYDAGSDVLFLAQNLRLLKPHGKLGLVLPDGLITGEKFKGIRSVLLNEHRVEKVIQLPRNVFAKTEAQTYLAILTKGEGPTESIEVSEIGLNGLVSDALQVEGTSGLSRLDYRFHSAAKNFLVSKNLPKLGALVTSLSRGTINSKEIYDFAHPVFHLSDFPTEEKALAFSLPKNLRVSKQVASQLPNMRIAQPGDILIARVGRNLHQKICMISSGRCIISDCIFLLQVGDKYRNEILRFLTSKTGRELLSATSHGVGASYLSRNDLLSLSLS